METIISAQNLTKKFGTVTAVDSVSLHVREGEIYGFLGLNGAGKTTTIRMLLGLIRPSSGTIRICNTEILPGGRGPWNTVGSLVEVPHSYPELTVRENLEIFRNLRGIKSRNAVDDIMETLRLSTYASRKAGTLSLGNAQRLGLAKALLHTPRVLILDEPSNGLDPEGIIEIRKLLVTLAQQHGVTIFVSSHILDEMARLATRIGIIHEGSIVKEIDTQELQSMSLERLTIKTRNPDDASRRLSDSGYAPTTLPDGRIQLTESSALRNPEGIATILVETGNPPMALYTEQTNLEEYFLRAIGRFGRTP